RDAMRTRNDYRESQYKNHMMMCQMSNQIDNVEKVLLIAAPTLHQLLEAIYHGLIGPIALPRVVQPHKDYPRTNRNSRSRPGKSTYYSIHRAQFHCGKTNFHERVVR